MPSLATAPCPWCNYDPEVHTSVSDPGAEPEPGDISLCWRCKRLSVFTDDGRRRPTDDELAQLDADPYLRQLLHAAAESYTPSEAVQMMEGVQRA